MESFDSGRMSRRNFMRRGAALGAGITGAVAVADGQENSASGRREKGTLNRQSHKLIEDFDLQYPIFQAAPGGEALAVAVANSGGMGAISLTWDSPEFVFDLVTRMNAATRGNYYANHVLHFEPKSLDKALEAGCPIVQFSWGIPNKTLVRKIRSAGARLGIQISSRQNAERALEHEPDFLICQGLEAGGHVQAMTALGDTLAAVLEVANEIPVVAAGGISTGHDLRRVIHAGAAGGVLGTRFMATQESDAHDVYKEQLVNAGQDSTAYTICFNRDWNAAHRILRNSTFLAWEAEGCPDTGSKPGEDDVIARHPVFGPALRYDTIPPLQGHEGQLEAMAMYAGQGVGEVSDLPTAKDLIARLWAEFENA